MPLFAPLRAPLSDGSLTLRHDAVMETALIADWSCSCAWFRRAADPAVVLLACQYRSFCHTYVWSLTQPASQQPAHQPSKSQHFVDLLHHSH